jgi:hypothetical protein
MIRLLVLLLLFAAAGTLVLALLRDRRHRQSQLLAKLRSAFLHGAPLAAPVRAASLREIAAPGGQLRFRLPETWVEESGAKGGLSFRDRSTEGRTLRLELQTSTWPEPVDAATVAATFGQTLPEKERSIEPLSNGNVLMRWLEESRDGSRELAVYRWRLGRPLPPHEVRIALFSLAVAAEQARDVVVQADLASIEREIRNAEMG